MTLTDRLKYLKTTLILFGITFVIGLYPLTILWPSGWSWHTGQSEYLQMILVIYATLGVFLIMASKDPLAHRSLIWFTVWSSVVHGGNHGGPIGRLRSPCRTFVWRRSCTFYRRRSPGIFDAADGQENLSVFVFYGR